MQAFIQIVKIEKFEIQAQNEAVLNVTFNIVDGDNSITKQQNFPLDSTSDFIKAELTKNLQTYGLDKEQAIANAKLDAANENADLVIEELKDAKIELSEKPSEEVVPEVKEDAPVETVEEVLPEEAYIPEAPTEDNLTPDPVVEDAKIEEATDIVNEQKLEEPIVQPKENEEVLADPTVE